jgi:hypothetical protein
MCVADVKVLNDLHSKMFLYFVSKSVLGGHGSQAV